MSVLHAHFGQWRFFVDKIRVDEAWILRFSRNLEAPNDNRTPGLRDVDGRFYVFDYYDEMTCWHENLNYGMCLGLEESDRRIEPISTVASNYVTLVSLSSDSQEKVDPFSVESTPDCPFLSLISVTPLVDGSGADGFFSAEKEVDSFLEHCTRELANETKAASDVFFEKMQFQEQKGKIRLRVFHSMNSGAFCIAVRSASIELGYCIAMHIRTMGIPASDPYPRLLCNTYTTTCICIGVNEDGVAVSPSIKQNNDSQILLRLAIDKDLISRITPASGFMGDGGGLYGRYDVTLRLSLNEFLHIYPYICAHKCGTLLPLDANHEEEDSSGTIADALISIFKEDAGIQCINERILVGGSVLTFTLESVRLHKDGKENGCGNDAGFFYRQGERVRREKKEIEKKINCLAEKGRIIPFCSNEFIHYIHMIRDMWRNYESLREQPDSVVNGNMFFTQMWLLLDIIDVYLDSMQNEDSQRRISYDDLMVSLRRAINSISHFQIMMQSVNQQSMQSPNYTVQMHCDLEKLIIAYTEFSRIFLAEHFPDKEKNLEKEGGKQSILPVFNIEPVKDSIRAEPLFLLPYIYKADSHLVETNPSRERLLLSIVLPDIETLGRLYRTLPMICHELSHNFRLLERNKRNDALCDYILNKVSGYVTRQWFSRSAENAIYAPFGLIEDRIQECISKELAASYRKYVGDVHNSSNIGSLITNILFWLKDEIFIGQDSYTRHTPSVSASMLKGVLEEMGCLYQQTGELADADWRDEYRKYATLLKESEKTHLKEEDYLAIDILSGKMEADIINSYFLDLMTDLHKLRRFIVDHFRTRSVQEENSFQAFVRMMEELQDKLNSVPISHYGIDCLIDEIENAAVIINEDFVFQMEQDEPSVGLEFELLRKKAVYAIHEFCRLLKNVCQLRIASRYRINSNSNRNQFLKNIKYSIRKELGLIQGRKDAAWVLFGSEKVQEFLIPLGLDQESDELFLSSFCSILDGFPTTAMEDLVKNSTQLYREVFADLGMCVSMGLDVFGYLSVLGNGSPMGIDTFRIERMRTVCFVLSSRSGSDPKGFADLCYDFYNSTICDIEQYLSDAGKQSDAFSDYKKMVWLFLSGKAPASASLKPFKIESVYSLLSREREDEYASLMVKMEIFWYTAVYVWYYRTSVRGSVNRKLLVHFREMYNNEMVDTFNRPGDSHLLRKIGKMYNNGQIGLDSCMKEEFQDMMSFVLFYYYKNWEIYSRGCGNIDRITEWTDSLMGRQA